MNDIIGTIVWIIMISFVIYIIYKNE
jgi:hypothetical protein